MTFRILLAAALAASPLTAGSQDYGAARGLAATCSACHGTEGRSVTKDVVSLAGLSKEHIAAQMKSFKDGARPATLMHQMAKGYTDQQIDLIAGYFAAQKK